MKYKYIQQKKLVTNIDTNINEFLFNIYRNLFINALIKRGRKLFAFNFFLQLESKLKTKNNTSWRIFLGAMMNLTPNIILYKINLGGVKKFIPFPITLKKQLTFPIKWTIKFLIKNKKQVTVSILVNLITAAFTNKGASINQKRITYKIALQNRALIKYFK